MSHVLYVYGTLRPGENEPVRIPGKMYDLGSYPGVEVLAPDCGSHFYAERIEVTDEKLTRLDNYEGFRPNRPESSLFLRVPYLDGEIYVYNHDKEGRRLVEGGDWLKHKDRQCGAAADFLIPTNSTDDDYAGAA